VSTGIWFNRPMPPVGEEKFTLKRPFDSVWAAAPASPFTLNTPTAATVPNTAGSRVMVILPKSTGAGETG